MPTAAFPLPAGTFFFPDFQGRPGFAVEWQFRNKKGKWRKDDLATITYVTGTGWQRRAEH